jgi:hypothetical protein
MNTKTTERITAFLTLVLIASFAGTMISVPHMIGTAKAANTVPCPPSYPTGPGPGGVCTDGVACPTLDDGTLTGVTVVSNTCTDGQPTCPPGTHISTDGKECISNTPPSCPKNYQNGVNSQGLCTDGAPNVADCPATPPNFKQPTVNSNGQCQVKPGQGSST